MISSSKHSKRIDMFSRTSFTCMSTGFLEISRTWSFIQHAVLLWALARGGTSGVFIIKKSFTTIIASGPLQHNRRRCLAFSLWGYFPTTCKQFPHILRVAKSSDCVLLYHIFSFTDVCVRRSSYFISFYCWWIVILWRYLL